MPQSATEPAIAGLGVAGGLLTIDLDAVAANYAMLRNAAPEAEVSAVMKANAYGLGLAPIARRLAAEGCRTFFVATAMEGAALREALPNAIIYIMNGLFPGTADYHAAHELRPALASLAEVAEWRDEAKRQGCTLSAALHFDSGMHRLGMSAQDADKIAGDTALTEGIGVALIMSHLACADDASHPQNAEQLSRFVTLREILAKRFPDAAASLANSGGIYLGPDYHFDLVRPGVSLYGGSPFRAGRDNPFRPVVTLEARVIAIRNIEAGDRVGYGATWRANEQTRIAILSAGYADGRPAPGGAETSDYGGQVHIAGYTVPVAGRVSMDLIAADLRGIPEDAIRRGDMAELIGPHIKVDDVGMKAGTIGYEILTSLGSRYIRRYISSGRNGGRG